jgi:transposase InsO family protein
MKFVTIDALVHEFPIAFMCTLLDVSTSGYYAWKHRTPCDRKRDDIRLALDVRTAFKKSKGHHGSPRITKDLKESGRSVGRRRIARIMRQEGLVARPRPKRRVQTTDSKHNRRIAPNILDRNFTANAPNTKWVSDITYVATFAGRMYLAVIIDLYSRMVVGWALDCHMQDDLVLEAFEKAVRRRRPLRGLVFHSDRGSQYASDDFLNALEHRGFVASMSRKANCWDNAVAESFFSTLKTELGSVFTGHAAAHEQVRDYIEVFYNSRRRHSSIGYVSPIHYELASHQTQLAA